MSNYIALFILSAITTGQANGMQKIDKIMLTESAYQSQEAINNYIHHPYKRIHVSHPWEYNEDYKGNNYKDEDTNFSVDDLEGERDSRRLFEWFSRLFHTTTPRDIQTSVTTESKYSRELKERIFLKALHRNLTDVLYKLSEVEKHVTNAIEQKETYSIFTKGKPQVVGLDNGYFYRERFKRNVGDEAKAETASNSSIADKSINITKRPIEKFANTTECLCEKNITSGRRAGNYLATPTEVKNKLLLYLQESFHEIKDKIKSLKNLKQAFSDNISFKIGYILANIDTLEVNMFNMKNNMDRNKQLWEDNKILELYDTLKVSNQAVSGLIESLKMYLEKLYEVQRKPETKFG